MSRHGNKRTSRNPFTADILEEAVALKVRKAKRKNNVKQPRG